MTNQHRILLGLAISFGVLCFGDFASGQILRNRCRTNSFASRFINKIRCNRAERNVHLRECCCPSEVCFVKTSCASSNCFVDLDSGDMHYYVRKPNACAVPPNCFCSFDIASNDPTTSTNACDTGSLNSSNTVMVRFNTSGSGTSPERRVGLIASKNKNSFLLKDEFMVGGNVKKWMLSITYEENKRPKNQWPVDQTPHTDYRIMALYTRYGTAIRKFHIDGSTDAEEIEIGKFTITVELVD